MFGAFKQKNPYEQPARSVYGALLTHIRQPVFYEELAVPDTFEGRFDVLVLHVFMVMEHMLVHEKGEVFNQTLFDVMFADMDQALREMGKGDMGVPKQMRAMMLGFNGRVHAYQDAFGDDEKRAAVIAKNIYNTQDSDSAKKMSNYSALAMRHVKAQSQENILAGTLEITNLEV